MLQLPFSSPSKAIPTSSPPLKDTTFDRIRRHKVLGEQVLALSEAEDQTIAAAQQIYGKRPLALIAWHYYSAIGGDEIKRARREFFDQGMPADVVEREYLDAKRRYRERKAECLRWNKAAGVYQIDRQIKAFVKERWNIIQSFIDEPPRTAKAASALIFYLLEFYDGCEFDELACDCLRGIAKVLSPDGPQRLHGTI
ncbi:hypothetical protein Nham_2411 [Nitrobacter hamburgensis X14]|uniref:Uncharacterized protein n=1 Tax=Nitrobacter hamburgensis (strain DSM 10229 / NCIMB 13809 / X14) TaxID=323097 RepID=Q1QKP5_NITHX|nr:hypothetical protein [Nitrobacter hamburgensis]ABE63202.1 hypothetical protein Nham_2411 [Nitrobacter hamburgensis X14]